VPAERLGVGEGGGARRPVYEAALAKVKGLLPDRTNPLRKTLLDTSDSCDTMMEIDRSRLAIPWT
jgi:hypothetical protein